MIVVGGEALVDLVPEKATATPELPSLAPRLGGGPYNVAIALARLGARISFLSRISTDNFGEALLHQIRESSVDTSLLQPGPEPTTLAVVTPGPDGSARYSFHVQGAADRLVTDPGPLPPQTRALSLGTLSLVLEPSATAYEAILHRESSRGTFVALDPNVRANLIEEPAAYRRRFEGWLPHLALLKLSEEDARWLTAGNGTALCAARRWARMGPAAVVLTRGGDGISVVTANATQADVPCTRSTIVDTIGAGDTVQAALLHWLHKNNALDAANVATMPSSHWRSALEFATAAAAISCSRPGAQPPFAAELATA